MDFAWSYLLVALMVVSCSALPQLDRNMGHPGEAPLPTPVGTCPEYSYNTVFLSDAYYCGYYHQCSNGVPIRMKCPSGLHWTVGYTDSYYFPTCDLPSQSNSNCRKDTPY
ncbi:hypothetical protein DAPPUDRAFT_249919 [Daphnia pulex]|uniref:Chitin-binding type-2 domain-containing protein n=1 Tax=Daphnia pulex TaxID=6669 RepID=E9GXJ5_DAPPU|nr:hypothetical protein DAPPUDRAFT_249919 [Daphnia pulex]|eukprot:EFX75665.1 hypothetical protein DAPPUDRAFT_249919 [Daphnia pulex]